MLESLKNNPMVRSLLILFLGLVLLNFLFALLFGSGNIMYTMVGIISFIIEILVLALIVAFFYGVYKIFKESGGPFLKELGINWERVECKSCGRKIAQTWNCCPICGSDR